MLYVKISPKNSNLENVNNSIISLVLFSIHSIILLTLDLILLMYYFSYTINNLSKL